MRLLVIALLFLGLSTTLSAYNSKGMKVWKKSCILCHGSPFRGAKMHTQMEWEEIRDGSKTAILDMHKNDEKSYKELKENFSAKKSKNLFKFLIGNAKDSGAVPGCDGNYCGPLN